MDEHEAAQNGFRSRTQNKMEFNIGTWNVLSLYRAAALKMLTDQLNIYRVDTVALQEI
jgi:mRNA deadenylase 3'-5' endonuclease subunit Ccr4